MIHINLLPPDLRPVKRTPIPYFICALIVVLVGLGMAFIYLNAQTEIERLRAERDQHTADFNQLKPIVDDYNNMIALKKSLSRKIETINEIVSDRIIWSRQLFNLSRVLPENFWLEEISVETRRETETRYELNPQTKEMQPTQVPVTKNVLSVSGYAIEGEDGYNVSPLVEAVEEDEEFAEMFRLEPPSLEDTTFDNAPVKAFTLDFVIQKGAGESAS